jgi:hypothetical protein
LVQASFSGERASGEKAVNWFTSGVNDFASEGDGVAVEDGGAAELA